MITSDVEEMKEAITKLPRYSAVICDEAMRVLYKLRWFAKSQIYLNQLFSLCRKENKVVLVCIPRFTDLNSYFRQWRIKIWADVISRGIASIFVKDWSQRCKDPWHLDEGQRLIEKHSRRSCGVSLTDKIDMLSKIRNYMTTIKFDDLDEETKKQYLEMKNKLSYDDLEKTLHEERSYREQKQRTALSCLLKILNDLNIPQTKIAKTINYPQSTISDLIAESNKYLEEHRDKIEDYEHLKDILTNIPNR